MTNNLKAIIILSFEYLHPKTSDFFWRGFTRIHDSLTNVYNANITDTFYSPLISTSKLLDQQIKIYLSNTSN